MPAGRPLEDLSSLPENWYEKILDLYEEGGSDVEVKAMIYKWRGAFSNSLWNRWLEEYEEFSQTVKGGKLLSEAWWNSKGRKNLENKEFSFNGWYMQMKNRFGWTDRTDHTTDSKPLSNTIKVEIIQPIDDDE